MKECLPRVCDITHGTVIICKIPQECVDFRWKRTPVTPNRKVSWYVAERLNGNNASSILRNVQCTWCRVVKLLFVQVLTVVTVNQERKKFHDLNKCILDTDTYLQCNIKIIISGNRHHRCVCTCLCSNWEFLIEAISYTGEVWNNGCCPSGGLDTCT
jgi:hypothetical protein